ncbi:hypothetical protein I4F81_007859 [Pyropia yezoensis]|uniref:Uncharacterized protein n=1 Tax=Pyropia yezoensis TaxID=2788 RepID=A0ACC3C6H6_PYRYE|nr:hypothetical protein I4F81_007859 [Neopyropia yezoensis]
MSRGEARSNLFLAGSGSSFSLLLRDVGTDAGRKKRRGISATRVPRHARPRPVYDSPEPPLLLPTPSPLLPAPSPSRPLPTPVHLYPINSPPCPSPSPPPPHPRVLRTQPDHCEQADPSAFGM